jgi:hypothetical protein
LAGVVPATARTIKREAVLDGRGGGAKEPSFCA